MRKVKDLGTVQSEYGVPAEFGIEEIAKGGSLLPHIVDDKGTVTQVTFCTSISGGQNELNGMPLSLNLVRYTWENGELIENSMDYFQGIPVNHSMENAFEKNEEESKSNEVLKVEDVLAGEQNFEISLSGLTIVLTSGETRIEVPLTEKMAHKLAFGLMNQI